MTHSLVAALGSKSSCIMGYRSDDRPSRVGSSAIGHVEGSGTANRPVRRSYIAREVVSGCRDTDPLDSCRDLSRRSGSITTGSPGSERPLHKTWPIGWTIDLQVSLTGALLSPVAPGGELAGQAATIVLGRRTTRRSSGTPSGKSRRSRSAAKTGSSP